MGADEPIADVVLVVNVVFSAETDTHHVRWIACHPLEPERLWVAIEAGALVSTIDGGRTWRDRVPGGPWDTHELAVHRDAPGSLRVSAGDGYFESDDAGATWRSPSTGLEVGYLRSVSIDPGEPEAHWVCRRVVQNWPARWLVADDVGLGKTIEAGLILWPLLSKGLVRRLLIVCPASLVEQCQYRLRTMFDIRLARYASEADSDRSDFWSTHSHVVASLETLRLDHGGRHQRLLESPAWDLLIVDEAHHVNADEEAGPTLGYKLAQRLVDEKKVASMVFFTGTPHRGKNFGFLALLHLLRPDLFNPREPLGPQLPRLRDVVIRNNKQSVTDLRGNRLFQLNRTGFIGGLIPREWS